MSSFMSDSLSSPTQIYTSTRCCSLCTFVFRERGGSCCFPDAQGVPTEPMSPVSISCSTGGSVNFSPVTNLAGSSVVFLLATLSPLPTFLSLSALFLTALWFGCSFKPGGFWEWQHCCAAESNQFHRTSLCHRLWSMHH